MLLKMLKGEIYHKIGLRTQFESEIILDTSQMLLRCFEMLLRCYGDARLDAKWLWVPRLVLKNPLEAS